MTDHIIDIAKDFSAYPGPRLRSRGPYSAEAFYRKHLSPALDRYDRVTVVLDGTQGIGSSFINEAFRRVVSEYGLTKRQALERLKVISEDDPYLLDEFQEAIQSGEQQTG